MILVYVTYPNKGEAQKVSKALLEARLVACANIFQPHSSMYWWEGEVASSDEVAVIYKSQKSRFEDIQKFIQEWHSYDVPCVVALPIEQGHPEFMQWIANETSDEAS